MQAGKLRHRITVQDFTAETDETGLVTKTWSTFADRWASVEPLRGRERWDAQQLNPEVTHRVRLRFLEGVRSSMRVLHKGRVLTIQSVIDPEERGISLELMCMEAKDVQ